MSPGLENLLLNLQEELQKLKDEVDVMEGKCSKKISTGLSTGDGIEEDDSKTVVSLVESDCGSAGTFEELVQSALHSDQDVSGFSKIPRLGLANVLKGVYASGSIPTPFISTDSTSPTTNSSPVGVCSGDSGKKSVIEGVPPAKIIKAAPSRLARRGSSVRSSGGSSHLGGKLSLSLSPGVEEEGVQKEGGSRELATIRCISLDTAGSDAKSVLLTPSKSDFDVRSTLNSNVSEFAPAKLDEDAAKNDEAAPPLVSIPSTDSKTQGCSSPSKIPKAPHAILRAGGCGGSVPFMNMFVQDGVESKLPKPPPRVPLVAINGKMA